MLVIFSGLPGVGKTTVARELARQIGAMYLRMDSIEQAIPGDSNGSRVVGEAGYLVAYAIAEDNLRIGRTVVADSVNPLQLTRDAWVRVAELAGVNVVEIEVTCPDAEEHRRRVEARAADAPGLLKLTWADVTTREYDPWNRDRLVIDSAGRTTEENVCLIQASLSQG